MEFPPESADVCACKNLFRFADVMGVELPFV